MTAVCAAAPNASRDPRAEPTEAELAPAPRGGSERFTLDGDGALEQGLALTCARVLSGVRGLIPPGKLEAVLLGGGYGRGEGGVLRTPEGNRPYNDLEFYVAVNGNRHLNELRYRRRLEVLGEILTHLADVEVEFKITSLAELAASPISMFSYDLAAGHRRLAGEIPAAWPRHLRAEEIPPEEATRLLMNRCSGLLFARAHLEREPFTPGAADFVRRNVAKAQLACGDAVLTAHGLYHWSCRERHRRLQDLLRDQPSPRLETLARHHALGVEFKLHPVSDGLPRAALLESHRQITALALDCWLDLETRRLGRPFASARAYAADPGDLCPGYSRGRNLVLNLRLPGPALWRHPRQRIFRALALLLWEPASLTDPTLNQRLRRELGASAETKIDWIAAYRRVWERVR